MKIIGICGSPRVGGNTEIMVKKTLRGAKEVGAKIELIHLGKINLEFCDGCLSCDETGECHLIDGMTQIYGKLREADGLILGSPARFDNVSGEMKAFIDRTNPLAKDMELKGKKVALLTVGYWHEDESRRRTLQSLRYFCKAHEMEVVGSVMAYEKSGRQGMVKKDKSLLKKCHRLGQKLASSFQ